MLKKILSIVCFAFLFSAIQAERLASDDSGAKLIYAEGKIFYNEVQIAWSTESEKGVAEFIVERSKDKKDWGIRGKIRAKGAFNHLAEYTLKDERDDSYKYYRIRSLEQGGTKILKEFELDNYSITVNLQSVMVARMKSLTIEYNLDKDQEIMLRVYNSIGEQVITRLMPFSEAGNYIYHLDVDELEPGNYLLAVTQTILDQVIAEKSFTITQP